jgi:hypothetical protein
LDNSCRNTPPSVSEIFGRHRRQRKLQKHAEAWRATSVDAIVRGEVTLWSERSLS